MDFNLGAMPLPANTAEACSLDQLPTADKEVATNDLFKRKRVKGWWPAYEVDDEGNRLLNVRRIVTIACFLARVEIRYLDIFMHHVTDGIYVYHVTDDVYVHHVIHDDE